MKKGQFLIVTGPSGSGKTTVVQAMLGRLPSAVRLVTTTTRAPRPKEKDGVDYHFVTREEFTGRIGRGEFLEWAEVYGNLYGSSKVVLEKLRSAHDVVFGVLDVQGAVAAKREVSDAAVIFLLAPLEQLRDRIARRIGAKPEDLARRMAEAEREIARSREFDYAIDCADGHLDGTCLLIATIINDRAS